MFRIKDITQYIERLAPLALQESYDNAGLIVGNPQAIVTGILVTLDCTEAVVEEALAQGCNLIIAHHPIVFKGLKKFNGKNYVERTVIAAIKNDVAIYASHTNLDHVTGGVNFKIAEQLQLQKPRILAPKQHLLKKLVTFVPIAYTQHVLNALYDAGAGQIGAYKNCSFRTEGIGTFKPTGEAQPFIGQLSQDETVQEDRIEVILPAYFEQAILAALKEAHPYEEVAYYLSVLENTYAEIGAGVIAELPEALSPEAFLHYLKDKMRLSVIKHTAYPTGTIRKIALCGGAGSFLLADAIRAKADVFITADYKYHEFFDAENKLMICDIGHYESEVYTKDLIISYLSEKFSNFAILKSQVNTNPVFYF